MLATIFTGTVRHRRPVLATAVVLAVSLLWLPVWTAPTSGAPFLVLLALAVLIMLAFLWRRPAALTVDPRRSAVRALPSAGSIYSVVWLVFASTRQIGIAVWSSTDTDQGPHHLPARVLTETVLLVGFCAVIVVQEWRGLGVELRPDGLTERNPFGTLTVPWEALAPGYPQPGPSRSLILAYARPELVHRRGVVFRRRQVAAYNFNVDPWFLAAAIAYYVAYPQYRPAIGTQDEYDRLLYVTNRSAPV